MTRVSIGVQSKEDQHRFVASIHESINLESLHLDPMEFYQKWGGSIPGLPHQEIEIVEPGEEFFKSNKLHIHRSTKTGTPFVCYPKRLETLLDAVRMFRTWCLGSVATIVEGVDLNTIYTQECGDNAERMEKILRERYGIHVCSSIVNLSDVLEKQSTQSYRRPDSEWCDGIGRP
ncbi:MAG: hypothetical protein AAB415_02190 [Patescibacteria group bacterium]